eukprot:symbB.v1.2.005072.t1/scaffold292.1/size239810/16
MGACNAPAGCPYPHSVCVVVVAREDTSLRLPRTHVLSDDHEEQTHDYDVVHDDNQKPDLCIEEVECQRLGVLQPSIGHC